MYEGYYAWLAGWMHTHIESTLFYLMAFMAIPLAYGILYDRRIIRCGFLLIGVFGTISGLFFLLQAQFLALAQLMIYAVGITLVVVIALMLTNPRMEHDVAPTIPEQKLPALIVSVVLFTTIYLGLRAETWQAHTNFVVRPQDNVMVLGKALLMEYALPFEFASVLLLIALVGAIMLAKADKPPREPDHFIEEAQDERSEENNVVKV